MRWNSDAKTERMVGLKCEDLGSDIVKRRNEEAYWLNQECGVEMVSKADPEADVWHGELGNENERHRASIFRIQTV